MRQGKPSMSELTRFHASDIIIRKEIARCLERSMFETPQEAFDGVRLEFSVARKAMLVLVRKGDFERSMMIDKDHLLWSLDDISKRYSLQDILFEYWALGPTRTTGA